jgi:hypothetical protein
VSYIADFIAVAVPSLISGVVGAVNLSSTADETDYGVSSELERYILRVLYMASEWWDDGEDTGH